MSDDSSRKTLSALIALATVWTLFFGFLAVVPLAAKGASCDQVAVITGTWTVTNAQDCWGIDFTLDGNLNINSGGSLTLHGGSISIIEDTTHIYAVNIASGGTLVLDHATLKTTPQQLNAYVKLAFNVNGGTLRAQNGSVLKFPGTLGASAGSLVEILGSTITGFQRAEVEPWVGSAAADDNDDAPTMTFTSATVRVFDSRIERLYEAASADTTRTPMYLLGTTRLTAINSYIGVDFHPLADFHNYISARDTSAAYLLNVTVDEVQSNQVSPSQWIPPYVPLALSSGTFYLYRWGDISVVDQNKMPVPGASVWTRRAPNGVTATYPDNANAAVPGATILGYMGKTAANFNVTDTRGKVLIPLHTDTMDTSTGRNSDFIGNYEQIPVYTTYRGSGSITFNAFPLITAAHNTKAATASIPGLALPRPELSISSLAISGGNGVSTSQPLNTQVQVAATVLNSGLLGQTGVVVSFFSVNVDADADGMMDTPPSTYRSTGAWIADRTVNLPASSSAIVTIPWNPPGGIGETTAFVSAVVDPPLSTPSDGGAVLEPNEKNNILGVQVALFSWPDLSIVSVRAQRNPVVNSPTPIDVVVSNGGTNNANGARILLTGGAIPVTSPGFNVARGSQATQTVVWTPTATGNQSFTVVALAQNLTGDYRTVDYALANNVASATYFVLSQPDLEVLTSDYTNVLNVTQNTPFPLTIRIYNRGATQASGIDVAVYLDGNLTREVNRTANIGIPAQSSVQVQLQIRGIFASTDIHTLMIFVDPNNQIIEGGVPQERNNFANVTINILPPSGNLILEDLRSTTLEPGTTIPVSGFVLNPALAPLPGIVVTVKLVDAQGAALSTTQATSGLDGRWQANLNIPAGLDGSYTLRAEGPTSAITPASKAVVVRSTVPFLFQTVPFLGLQWWFFLLIVVIVAGIAIGATTYVKVFGLGKMVECGECGAFIPEDSTSCPKCGVEFEKDMAKCSNCQAWIPIDVKQCPECGVEFATGQVEMADYQEKMKMQYDEVVSKFREEASRQLGRQLSDREFQDWWRKQPTFVTFEDWLREEEEMRKMGSKPCPACGTLNSVTATVCHKCGTFLKEEKRAPAAREVPKRVAAPEAAPEGAPEPAEPRRVVKKPSTGPPVVRKVIRRVGEPGEGEQSDQSTKTGEEEL